MTDTERAFEDLRDHVEQLDVDKATEKVDLSRDLLIDCPDCQRQIAFNGACPKCGGTSWTPAGKRIEVVKPSTDDTPSGES